MKRPFIDARFYETYYLASAVRNILADQFAFLRRLDEFYGDNRYLALVLPFKRYSAFHVFVEWVVGSSLTEYTQEVDLEKRKSQFRRFGGLAPALNDLRPFSLPIERALDYYGTPHLSFTNWLDERSKGFLDCDEDDVSEYLLDLRLEGPLEDFFIRVAREVFFVLFGNRRLLLQFNDMIASQVCRADLREIPQDYRHYFDRDGVLKRSRTPQWAKRTVLFRDRGLCVVCRKDLSGILSASAVGHFDHMVPLASGGLNDVSNLQLLCADCNLKKGTSESVTSDHYEDWYPIPEEEGDFGS